MNDANQPPPARRSSFFLEDLVVAAVRGIDAVSTGFRQPWRWRRSNDGPGAPKKSSPPRPRAVFGGAGKPAGEQRVRVLLVESEPLTRLMLTDRLQSAGLEVEAAPDVGSAFQHLRTSLPDAIFMELVSGGIHATELIREARRNATFATRPIYVYTCQGFNVTPGQGIAGADQVFNKFFQPAGTVVETFLNELGVKGEPAIPLSEADASTLSQIPILMSQQAAQIGVDLQALAQKSNDVEACTAAWKELRSRVRGLVSCAAVAGKRDLARQTAAMEAFLKELNAEPNHVEANSWQTLCSAAEVLSWLADENLWVEQLQPTELTAVVVDEKLESRMDTTHALLNAGFAAVSFPKPAAAVKHLESQATNLLVVDLGLSLESFCEQAQSSSLNSCVIFIQRSEWDSVLPPIGATRLCARNLSGPHLGLKALTLVHQLRRQARLEPPTLGTTGNATAPAEVAPAPNLDANQSLPPAEADPALAAETVPAAEEPLAAASAAEPFNSVPLDAAEAPSAPEVINEAEVASASAPAEAAPVPAKPAASEVENNIPLENADPRNPEPGVEPDPTQAQGNVMQMNYKPKGGKMQPIPSDIPDVFFKSDAPAAEASATVTPGPTAKPKAIAGLADIPDLFFKGPGSSEPAPVQSKPAEPIAAAAPIAALPAAETAAAPAPPDELAKMPWPEPPSTIETRTPKSETEFARRAAAERVRESMMQRAYNEGMQQHRLEAVQEAEARKQLENQVQSLVAANALLERRLMEQNRSHDEMARYSAELQEKLQAAEDIGRKEMARVLSLEQEMADFRRDRDQIREKLLSEQQVGLDSQRRFQDLEHSLREKTAELEQARLELERAAVERTRLEAERDEIKPVSSDTVTLPGSGILKKAELERQLREKVSALAQATAELENEKGERRRCEQRAAALAGQLQSLHAELSQHLEAERTTHQRIATLEQRIIEREQTISQVRSDLQKESADRRLAEEELRTATDLGRQMQNNLALYEETRKLFKATQEQLEAKLKGSLAALNENEAKLHKEGTERLRLREALDESQRALKEQTQTSALELSKVQSGMQLTHFEKKCLEAELLRTRQDSVNSARANRAVVHNLRQQLKQPVDNLYLFACQLLRKELPDEQKKVAQTLLENALLLQTTLRESDPISSEASTEVQPGTPPPAS